MKHTFKDFYPLIGMVSLVLVLTFMGVQYLGMSPMHAGMGFFFLVFGTLKILRLRGFVEAYRMYDIVAARSRTYAYLYPFLEIGFGLAYLTHFAIELISYVVFVVMVVSALGVVRTLLRRETVPCACLGTVFTVPMTWVTLGEDLIMASMALLML